MIVPVSYPDRRVCIIGLGYVGLTLAVAMAEAGFSVRGVERNSEVVSAVRAGRPHFVELGLAPRLDLQVAAGNLEASMEWPAPGEASVYIITVGTPLGQNRATNLEAIKDVAVNVSRILRKGDLVVLRSTVRVAVCRDIVKPILDNSGVAYDLAFCPERTIEGKALLELRTLPQIIGGLNDESALRASQLFNFLTPTTIRVRDLETAEMIKLINNTQRDLLFAFANEVAEICDAVGVSAAEVINAGNMGYSRSFVPLPGPVGGPCLEKDPYILADSVKGRGRQPELTLLGRAVNERLPLKTVRSLQAVLDGRAVRRVAIAGLAFKGRPETSDLRGSLAIPLIAELRRGFSQADVIGYDPAVRSGDIESLGLTVAATAEEAFVGADCVVFQTNNRQFEGLDLASLALTMARGGVVCDLWNQFDIATINLPNNVRYFGLGSFALLKTQTLVDA